MGLTAPINVPCARCGANVGEMCQTSFGRPTRPHQERTMMAMAVGRAADVAQKAQGRKAVKRMRPSYPDIECPECGVKAYQQCRTAVQSISTLIEDEKFVEDLVLEEWVPCVTHIARNKALAIRKRDEQDELAAIESLRERLRQEQGGTLPQPGGAASRVEEI